jgi:hypothetical protein
MRDERNRMKIPPVFHWPSPWLWGALGVLIITNQHGFWGWIQGAATVTLIASAIFYIRGRLGRSSGLGRGGSDTAPMQSGSLQPRLEAIERRLTDTQDVMIALSEKVDQWEAERAQAARSSAARSPETTT